MQEKIGIFSYSSTMTMEAIYSSEASVYFQRTTRRYNPEDRTPHKHRSENLKFYLELDLFEEL
jgi:hypothetical protein